MAVPCVSDTDCIVASLDGQNRLQLSLVVDPDGGLECVGGTGLRARIQGDPAAVAPSDCHNLLRFDTNGDLLAQMPGWDHVALVKVQNNPISLALPSADTILATGSLSNASGCTQIMQAIAEVHFGFTIDDAGTGIQTYVFEANSYLTVSGAGITAANVSTGLTANMTHEQHGAIRTADEGDQNVSNMALSLPVFVPYGATANWSLHFAAMPAASYRNVSDLEVQGNGHVIAFRSNP